MSRRNNVRLPISAAYGAGDDYDDYDDYDEEEEDGELAPVVFSTAALLRDLLGALGIEVDHSGGAANFKQRLYEATMAKVKELTGGMPNGKRNGVGNPLIPGATPGDVEPMYLSLNRIERIADPKSRSVALALADQAQGLRHMKAKNDALTARQREDKFLVAYAKRDARISRILRVAPQVRKQLNVALNQPSMAFSLDAQGNVTDPCEQLLTTLERGLSEQYPALKNPAQTDEDAAVAALARYMR